MQHRPKPLLINQFGTLKLNFWVPDRLINCGLGGGLGLQLAGYANADGSPHDSRGFGCPDENFLACLQDEGVVYRVETYVPDAEYIQMMLIISGLNLVAGTLLAAGAGAVRRRDVEAAASSLPGEPDMLGP